MGITYNVRQAGGVTVVELGGRITLETNAPGSGMTLHDLVRDLLKQGRKHMLLNLREVAYIDSSGIGALFGCLTTVKGQGGLLKMSNPNERIQNLLRLTMLNTVIEVIEDESKAVQSFPKVSAAS